MRLSSHFARLSVYFLATENCLYKARATPCRVKRAAPERPERRRRSRCGALLIERFGLRPVATEGAIKMAIPAAVAKKIAEAKTSKNGTPIKAGEYTLLIKRILCDGKFTGLKFIPEFEVVDCEPNGEMTVGGDGRSVTETPAEPNKVGSECSCAWALDAAGKKGEAMLGNIKQFMCSLLGLDLSTTPVDEIMSKAAQWAGPSGDPDALRARGMLISCSTKRRRIQNGENAGKLADFPEFTHVTAADGNSPEKIAERRAVLDAAGK